MAERNGEPIGFEEKCLEEKSGMTQTKKYGWTLTLITALLSCGSGGDEAVNTGPLLSQEGTSQGGLAGKLAPEESTKSDTLDTLSVAVSESTDREREAERVYQK